MRYMEEAKALKQNTEVLTGTFEKFNFKVKSFSYEPIEDGCPDCNLYLELEVVDDVFIPFDGTVVVNVFDDAGNVFFADTFKICIGFTESGMFKLYLDEDILSRAKSARLYMVEDALR